MRVQWVFPTWPDRKRPRFEVAGVRPHMLRTVFADVRDGRISRLGFLAALLALSAVGMAMMLGVFWISGAASVAVSPGVGTDPAERVVETLGRPWLLVLSAIGMTVFFGQANLWAKRFRDLGQPGWWAVMAVIVAGLLLADLAGRAAASAAHLAVLLVLLVVPGRGESRAPA